MLGLPRLGGQPGTYYIPVSAWTTQEVMFPRAVWTDLRCLAVPQSGAIAGGLLQQACQGWGQNTASLAFTKVPLGGLSPIGGPRTLK